MSASLKLVAFTLCLPVELSFYVFGLRFTAVRLIFLLLTPALALRFVRKISSGKYRFVLSDLLIVLTGLWFLFAPANIDGLAPALNHAGPEVLEFCIGYMTTRVLLSGHDQALSMAQLLCRIVAVVALIGLLDPLTGHYVAHEVPRQLTGYTPLGSGDNYRMGLLRASGPLEDEIWYGYLCVAVLLISLFVPIKPRLFITVSCSLGVIFALSSAPIQALLFGILLLIYNRVTRSFRFRWLALISAGAIAIVSAFLISGSPIGWVISHLTFDPSTGYYRYWTWDRVMFYVSQSPWFGLGFDTPPDEINHSIDALWLVLAMHYGWPGAILVGLSCIGSMSLPVNGPNVNLTAAESRLGTILSIVIVVSLYLAFTVDILGILWIFIALLLGMRAHLGELGRVRDEHRLIQRL